MPYKIRHPSGGKARPGQECHTHTKKPDHQCKDRGFCITNYSSKTKTGWGRCAYTSEDELTASGCQQHAQCEGAETPGFCWEGHPRVCHEKRRENSNCKYNYQCKKGTSCKKVSCDSWGGIENPLSCTYQCKK